MQNERDVRGTLAADGFEFAFAPQYFARACLNRPLLDRLAASGDGRIVHIAGNVPDFVNPDLNDLQFARRMWSFFRAILAIVIAAACVGF
jgi:hypothetical protein